MATLFEIEKVPFYNFLAVETLLLWTTSCFVIVIAIDSLDYNFRIAAFFRLRLLVFVVETTFFSICCDLKLQS